MTAAKKIGLLLDIDGVVYNDNQLITGAPETIQWLRDHRIPFRFITNTTMRSRRGLCRKLHRFGIDVEVDEIFSAVSAAVSFIRNSGKRSCHLLLCEDAKTEFVEFDLDNRVPDYVVIGDLGDQITFELLNTAFQKLVIGAQLLGLQKNRYWISDKGITLDAGAFVAMLEFAAQKKAIIVGKPSETFFNLALQDLHVPRERVYMVGDDVESDIMGAYSLGINGILVESGKYNRGMQLPAKIQSTRVIRSIAELPALLKTQL